MQGSRNFGQTTWLGEASGAGGNSGGGPVSSPVCRGYGARLTAVKAPEGLPAAGSAAQGLQKWTERAEVE